MILIKEGGYRYKETQQEYLCQQSALLNQERWCPSAGEHQNKGKTLHLVFAQRQKLVLQL